METPDKPRWSLDRRVPIVLLLTILAQTGIALVWAGEAHQRFVHLERQVDHTASLSDRTIRLEEKIAGLHEALLRIEAKLDRVPASCQEPRQR